MMKKIRMGWIGCGGIAKTHALQMEDADARLKITAAVDVELDRAEAMRETLGDIKTARDYREIMDDVDAVLIALPHDLHAPIGLDFLNAGKHVLMEKPMANTEEECWALVEAAKKADRTLMVAYCMRYHPLVRKMKEVIDSKKYGKCFQVSIWTEQYTRYTEGHWALSADRLGGGQFFSHGCHYVDILLWYLGLPVRGIHLGSNFCTPWMEKEGTSNVTIQFENGAMGYHFGTWGAKGTRLKYSFHAHCEEGMIEYDRAAGKLNLIQGDEITVLAEDKGLSMKPMKPQMVHFLDCIESGQKPLTDAISSIEGLRVIWKLYDAEEKNIMADLRGEGLGTASNGR
jgi:predicted dehydrogenase